MYIANKALKNFLKRHNINILDAGKRTRKIKKTNKDYFTDPTNYNLVITTEVSETEPLYTIEISESELKRIADFESQVFNNLINDEHYNLFEVIIGQKDEECRLRTQYSAVQKAFEQYSLLLKMAQANELQKENKE